MILTIAISHRDIENAARLLKWIAFLSAKSRFSILKRKLLIVASPIADKHQRMAEILTTANATFSDLWLYVPEKLDESGYPKSCNMMLQEALRHVESYWQDDMLWVEPDAVPLVPEWFDRLLSEFDTARLAGKSFMGAHQPHRVPHMSGIGVYGRNWRSVAPLIDTADREAWDTWAADEIMPNAHFTPLVRHVFNGPPVRDLAELGNAVIYHQCKTGALIKKLDQERWGGELYGTASDIVATLQPMPKYYRATNANRLIAGLKFDIFALRAGTAFGVYEAVADGEIAALDHEAQNPRSAVVEITVAEFEQLRKKKPRSFSNVTSLNRPIVPVKPGVAQPAAGASRLPLPEPMFERAEDALKVGSIAAHPLAPTNSKRPRADVNKV